MSRKKDIIILFLLILIRKLLSCKVAFTFHNPYLRSTVTELQKFRDVFIRNTHVGVPLGTVEGEGSLLPFSQISGTDFCYKDRKGIVVQRSLNHNKVETYFKAESRSYV